MKISEVSVNKRSALIQFKAHVLGMVKDCSTLIDFEV
jgi:hypothetical protein